MIFYFSGTGNTRWAAIKLAAASRESLIDMAEETRRMKQEGGSHLPRVYVLQKDERLGFVFPVHGWRVPKLVRRFIEQMRIKLAPDADGKPFCYAVCTAGDSIGLTIDNLDATLCRNDFLPQMGITAVASAYSLIMPESYVGLPFMDVDTQQKEQAKKTRAAQQLTDICADISERHQGIFQLVKGPTPWFFTKVVGGFFEHVLITDKRFHVTPQKCVRCGICANVCPVDDIDGGKGKQPRWLHHGDCLTCFACYHHCPHHAIEFGHQTQKKGQYYFK